MRVFPRHDFTKGMVKMEFKRASEIVIKEGRKFSGKAGGKKHKQKGVKDDETINEG